MRLRGRAEEVSERPELDAAFSVAYEELRRLAAGVKKSDPRSTMNPTALVNEAWVKLAAHPGFTWESDLHFKRIAARAMRQLLVESARRRQAHKRSAPMVTFDEGLGAAEIGSGSEEEFLRLDQAIGELTRLNARQALIVESRFFGGMDVEETARVLGVSEATVQRDWRAARAWLQTKLRRAQ
jgi:RNA polymerase sigma factor (TIGR02999 family)